MFPPPWSTRPPASLRAALYPYPPVVRPSLCPTPISHAATTSEGATRTTIPDVWKIGESERRENGVRGDEQGKVQAQADKERLEELLDE